MQCVGVELSHMRLRCADCIREGELCLFVTLPGITVVVSGVLHPHSRGSMLGFEFHNSAV